MTFFVNAPPTKATVVPEGFNPRAMGGPGYVLKAATAKDAVATVKAFRLGAHWSLDLVEVVR